MMTDKTDHYPPVSEWRKAMKAALAREKKPLFNLYKVISGASIVAHDSRAWCCSGMTMGSTRLPGPRKIRAHLRAATHFREWCIEYRDLAIARFPEVKPLFAEFELLKTEKSR